MFGYHDSTLAEAFADVAAAHAGAPAVLTQDVAITYAELAARAGGVARRLRESGDIGDRVGLRLDHGIDMISGMLGALAAGRIYVPLDPTYPSARLTQMREQAGIDTVLDSLDDIAPAPFEVTTVAPTEPAYILFTSGSTGRPKGVTHTHRSVLHGIANHVDNLSIGPGDRLSLLTSFSFDMSVSDLYAAVLSGATVVTFDLRRHGFARLAEVLVDRAVTVYHSTPTVFRNLVDVLGPRRLPSIRVVVLGGEQVNRSDLRQVRERCARDCVLVNGYGATEASFAIQNHLRASDPEPVYAGEVVPIGSPLRGYTIRLVDPEDKTVDVTALDDDTEPSTGEIAIVSDYLASGYWGDPEQTAARFDAGGRVYRTGDLATRLPDGALLYLGRSDRQVKVRGHRLELAEVEAQLAALPEVARAVAVARSVPHGGTEVIGYVQRRSGTSDAAARALDAARLRDRLRDRVPDFMVPRTLVVVDRFVLTPTGKVDHAALPEPTVDEADPGPSPANATAGLVARAWHAALGVPAIGTDVNFFDAGGDSLALARLQRELARLGHDVDLQVLLAHPTIEDLADLLDASPVTGGPGSTPPASPRVASWGRASRERQGDEIAIIGMAGRFPGCPDVPTLWRRLLDAADCTSGAPVPVEEFDAEFFGIDPDEAARWDPQHRLFLETSW
ncbi:MAG TPA: amino acid adenylation domain-containing protein, partial [Actinopolymorphaceae bacterium]